MDIAETPESVPDPPTPLTCTGLNRTVVLPSPTAPSSLYPQQTTPPEACNAHIVTPPLLTAEIPDSVPVPPTPVTDTGLRRVVVVPSPSSPWLFEPQHRTAPETSTAQVL